MSERIRPFGCGTQDADWQDRNCVRCTKYKETDPDNSCELDRALLAASFGDGYIDAEVARRMGYTRESYTWDCPERESHE